MINNPNQGMPNLSWFPVRFIREIGLRKKPADLWLYKARKFGFRYVELHHVLIINEDEVEKIYTRLKDLELKVSMLTCAPDFTNPDFKNRKNQIKDMKRKVDVASYLGAPAIRVTAGMDYAGIDAKEAINWVCESLLQLTAYAESKRVKLCLENHYRDRMWDKLDFAAKNEIFTQIYDRLRSTPVMVNFDTSQPMVMKTDGISLLKYVKDKVYNVHAGDRIWNEKPHVVIGEGQVDFDGMFSVLKSVGYSRFISVEDGSTEGDEGLRRGLSFLKKKISKYWG